MGCGASSRCPATKTSEELRADVRRLREDIEEMRRARQRQTREYERRLAAAEEVAARLSEEIHRRRRCLDAATGGGEDGGEEWQSTCSSAGCSVAEEAARREETVEKWKQLYLAIKTELDELIRRTREEGGRFGRGSAENINSNGALEDLLKELSRREESMEALTSKIAAMQIEAAKKDREIDILRQCLKILGSSANRDLSRTRRKNFKK